MSPGLTQVRKGFWVGLIDRRAYIWEGGGERLKSGKELVRSELRFFFEVS